MSTRRRIIVAITGYLTLCLLFTSLTGCLALPIPNARVEGSGIKSRVMDATTLQPVANATVLDPIHCQTSVTNRNGQFCLAPHYQWHAGYLISAISYPIWPTTGDIILPRRLVRVVAPGYISKEFDIGVLTGDIKPTETDHDVLIVPPLLIQKAGTSGEKNEHS